MPNPTEVAIIKRDGSVSLYSDYKTARDDAVDYDLIQIRADLSEQIVLKDKVDIWIMPGVVLDYDPSSPSPTITDNNVAVECSIYGKGVIKNTRNNSSTLLNTILISNSNSKITIECDKIENDSPGLAIACISSNAAKFHLKCNNVFGKRGGAIFLNNSNSNINVEVTKVETGLEGDSNTGSSAVITRGNGFIKIDEILCRNTGHSLSQRAGKVLARIKKLTTINNRSGANIACVHVPSTSQGTGTEELILYFDEIQSLEGEELSGTGIEATGGKSVFIGRRVFSSTTYAFSFGGSQTKGGYFKCDEIISESSIAIQSGAYSEELNIYANKIEGNYTAAGFSVVILSTGVNSHASKLNLSNAKIKNNNTSS